MFRSMEELMTGGVAPKEGESKILMKEKEKEYPTKKGAKMDSKALGLKIFAGESKPFPKQLTYQGILEGMKSGNFKFIYGEEDRTGGFKFNRKKENQDLRR